MNKIRVGVLFGGRSGEHEISILSASSIIQALDKTKYEIFPIGITQEGKWIYSEQMIEHLSQEKSDTEFYSVLLSPDPVVKGIFINTSEGWKKVEMDVLFPIIHGPFGEDGTLQGLFELADIAYVGAGVLASSIGMDKAIQKKIFLNEGLPIVEFISFKETEYHNSEEHYITEIYHKIHLPCFVKPVNLGSSVGITKATSLEELKESIRVAFEYDRKIIIEAAVQNVREFECGVLGNDELLVSGVGEIKPSNEFYDYNAKYIDGKSDTIIQSDITDELRKQIQDLALAAFRAIDCEGMARVDFLYDQKNKQLFLNEINTIPGFTTISMYPKLMEAAGIPFSELLDRLITLAIQRQNEKRKLKTSYTVK